jgi:chromosome condensin MukBEF ATPase and DNA-binding subunit MukB
MAENSLFMIHNAWGGTSGEAKDMRKTAETLDKITSELTDIYVKKTGLSYDALAEMMDEESWLNAKVAAKYDVSKFKNITQEEIKNKLSININNKKMTNELKDWFNSKVEEIVTAVKGEVKVSADVAEQTAITVNLGDNEEITNKISEFEAKNIELSNKMSLLEEELVSAKGNNETLTVEVEGLNAKINKADAKGTELAFYDAMAARIRNKFNN